MTRPILDLEKSELERTLDAVALIALLFYLGFIAYYYPQLPERVPSHFGPNGEPDAWSGKGSLLMLPLLCLGMFILFTFIKKIPHKFNYMVKITPENAEAQYRKAVTMIAGLNAGIIIAFMYISWRMIAIARGAEGGLGKWFLPVFLILTFLPIVVYFFSMGKKDS